MSFLRGLLYDVGGNCLGNTGKKGGEIYLDVVKKKESDSRAQSIFYIE